MKKKAKKRLIIAAVFAVLCALSAWGFAMETVSYDVETDKFDNDVRIAFISDLHNCFYGDTDNSKLLKEVRRAEPDIVVFGGDIIDMWGGTQHALDLMKALSIEYPCFYSPGNHEEMRGDMEEFFDEARKLCPLLMGKDYADITVKGQDIRLFGAINATACYSYSTQLEECFENMDDKHYNILVAHQPEDIDYYLGKDSKNAKDFDLILSGHAHGGQWRLPKILEQGLYAPEQGMFPKYTTGIYHYDETTHIISRGLARPMRMIFIPRIFNRPELSIIDIHN